VHTQVPLCPECDDSEMFEDLTNGQMVCRECGLTERLLLSDDVKWCDMDWNCMSITQKSQHQPTRYFLELVRKFKIDETVVPELANRFKACKYWAERTRPDGRKSLPSYRKCRCCIYIKSNVSGLYIRLHVHLQHTHCIAYCFSSTVLQRSGYPLARR